MDRTIKMTLFPFGLTVVLLLLTYVPGFAQWRTQNIVTSAQDTDLSVSPSKGPDDAPVEIAVFSCFQ
jgi:hypothetical protein